MNGRYYVRHWAVLGHRLWRQEVSHVPCLLTNAHRFSLWNESHVSSCSFLLSPSPHIWSTAMVVWCHVPSVPPFCCPEHTIFSYFLAPVLSVLNKYLLDWIQLSSPHIAVSNLPKNCLQETFSRQWHVLLVERPRAGPPLPRGGHCRGGLRTPGQAAHPSDHSGIS